MKRKVSVNRTRNSPFWLPAASFYFLAMAVAICIFFLAWAILAETRDESPWITAGLLSSVSMISAVVVREVILRQRRNAIIVKQRKLDRSLLSVPRFPRQPDPDKLTLERNAYLIEEIGRKSEAAMVLGRLAESHREVFQLCEQYIEVATRELAHVGVGSPRLAAITRGRDKAERIHRQHMLRWAEIEVRAKTQEASESDRSSVRLDKARSALRALNAASAHYPDEPLIAESRIAIEQFILSSRIMVAFERAKRAEQRGDIDKAIENLYEADRLIQRDPEGVYDTAIMQKVRGELERLLDIAEL